MMFCTRLRISVNTLWSSHYLKNSPLRCPLDAYQRGLGSVDETPACESPPDAYQRDLGTVDDLPLLFCPAPAGKRNEREYLEALRLQSPPRAAQEEAASKQQLKMQTAHRGSWAPPSASRDTLRLRAACPKKPKNQQGMTQSNDLRTPPKSADGSQRVVGPAQSVSGDTPPANRLPRDAQKSNKTKHNTMQRNQMRNKN